MACKSPVLRTACSPTAPGTRRRLEARSVGPTGTRPPAVLAVPGSRLARQGRPVNWPGRPQPTARRKRPARAGTPPRVGESWAPRDSSRSLPFLPQPLHGTRPDLARRVGGTVGQTTDLLERPLLLEAQDHHPAVVFRQPLQRTTQGQRLLARH